MNKYLQVLNKLYEYFNEVGNAKIWNIFSEISGMNITLFYVFKLNNCQFCCSWQCKKYLKNISYKITKHK